MITLGGDAELELVDTLDPFNEGIHFSVRPPKKSPAPRKFLRFWLFLILLKLILANPNCFLASIEVGNRLRTSPEGRRR